ncbi:MAG: NAD(P)/FAD-dependent oxidoreductase, partial [Candidatus Bathyarchaeia archaeon]
NLSLAYPKGDELERTIMGIEVYSPDMETVFKLSGEGLYGFIVDRRLFGQRLLKEAMDAGAMLLDYTQVIEPIIEDRFVRGVVARDRKTNGKKKILGSVTIDASGCSAVIRRRLPPEMGIETTIDKRDEVICYREIRILKNELEEPEYCKIYLDVNIAPGGYYWIFPKRGSKVNVGLGVAALANFPNPKDQLYKFVLSREIFKNSILIHGGGGIVPTRRPLDSFVSNGVVVIGDAACNVNPIHGGGIGPSMMAGKISGEVISDVLETGEPTVEKLWPINIRYMKTYGAKQASLDIFRLFLQSLSNEDINYGMKYKIIREDDVLKAGIEGDVRLNITDATRRLFMGLGRVSFLRKLYKMAKKSKALKKIYEEYPLSPKNMPEWKLKIKSIWEN